MSRKKLSEFRAKSLIFATLGQGYQGIQLDSQDNDWGQAVEALTDSQRYVVKVDQAEKGRFKKGLVKLDRQKSELAGDAEELFKKGYQFVLVEQLKQHEPADEKYLTIERLRQGKKISFSNVGGVDVESHADQITSQMYDGQPIDGLDIPGETLEKLAKVFDDNYFSFLEINPFTILDGQLQVLDAAVEVDDEATFFEDGWQATDIRSPRASSISEEELIVRELSDKSQASFSLERINADGSVWLLLSGGGASVMVADEVHNLGYGKQLGNYGEYSGNPNTEETRHYTEQVIKLMLNSKAERKVLIIAGGVANFTDVRQTFKGVIEALKIYQDELLKQGCAVYVRRGGPYEKEGLKLMKDYLEQAGISGEVSGPELLLSDIVAHAVKGIGA
jgi:succinyl-CoA synthetase beta subunit